MAQHMMTLRLNPEEANIASASRKLNIKQEEIDPNFGVVCINPAENLYTVLVDEAVSTKLQGRQGIEGPFSNPKIEPYGPPIA